MTLPIRTTLGQWRRSRLIVPAILIAAGVVLMIWFPQANPGGTQGQRYLPYAMGGLFILGGVYSILRELRSRSDRVAAERALKDYGDAPWRVRPEWRSNELRAGSRVEPSFLWLCLFWNLFSWPLALYLIASESGPGNRAVWLVALFPAIGLGMLGTLIFEVLRGWKFGRTLVALDTMPLRLGQPCRGRMKVKMDRDAQPEGGFQVAVSCYRQQVRYRRDSDGKRTRELKRDLLWRDETRFRGDPTMDGTSVEIPFAFTLPEGVPSSTALKLDNRILWEVSAKAAVPGIDFMAAVEVPVFPPEIGAAAQAAPVPPRRIPDFPRTLSHGIVLVEEPDRFELHFTAARKRKGAILLGVIGAVFVVFGFPLVAATGPVGLIFVIMGGVLVFGSLQQGTNDTVLQIEGGSVSVVHDGIGMPPDVHFPVEQVQEVRVHLGTGSSQRARYALILVARAGEGLEELEEQADTVMGIMSKVGVGRDHPAMEAMRKRRVQPRIQVADDLADKDEADALASRIREAIRSEIRRRG